LKQLRRSEADIRLARGALEAGQRGCEQAGLGRHRRIADSLVADEPGELATGALAVQAEAVPAESSAPEANETQACEPAPGQGVD